MTRSENMEHVEVLERLRGVLEHGKMGDKCLIAPDLVTAAIAALSAPAEAQPCGCGEATCTVPWEPGCGLGKSEQHAEAQAQGGREVFGWVLGDAFVDARFWTAGTPPQGWTPVYLAHPSAPVGVVDVDALAQEIRRVDGEHSLGASALAEALVPYLARTTLAQQPASDGGFTAADMMDARQEGRKEAQQPAAVDEAMVERAWIAAAAACVSVIEGKHTYVAPVSPADWYAALHPALTAALAAQQGGRSDD